MSKPNLLSPAQRTRLLAFPTEERDLARHYTLTGEDLKLIDLRRRDHNRLGFAVQLCFLRYPGRVLAEEEVPPSHIIEFIAAQLGIPSSAFVEYAKRDETRREHLLEIQKKFGLRPFDASLYKELSHWLMPVALGTDKGEVLVSFLLEEMQQRRIILPPLTAVERLAEETRRRARRQTYQALTRGLTEEQQDALNDLLGLHPNGVLSWLSWLRQPADGIGAASFNRHIERLKHLRGLGIELDRGRTIHRNRLTQLSREGGQNTVQNLATLEPERRLATLVATLQNLSETITDETIQIFDRMLGSTFRKCERRYAMRFQASAREINETVRLFAQVGKAILQAKADRVDPIEAIDKVVPLDELATFVKKADALARPEEFDYLELAAERYAMVRKYAPTFLSIFDFKTSAPARPLLRAVEMLREMNDSGRRNLPDHVPTDFIRKRWRRLVFPQGKTDRKFYELCVLSELRARLRAGDVWVVGSRQYRDFEEYLIPKGTFTTMLEEGPLPVAAESNFRTFIGRKKGEMADALERVCAKAPQGQLPDVTIENGRLSIIPIKKSAPDEAKALARLLYGTLPRVKITDLLLEVDTWTGFTEQFTHQHSSLPPEDKEALLSVILADGINLGLGRMAEACKTVSLRRLTWTADCYIRDECYSQALAQVINAHHGHPFSSHWGEGSTSSSDGQYFKAGGHGEVSGQINTRYGDGPGIKVYVHTSDQFSPFHAKVISATESEAPYLLDGLLYHDSDLEIREHYTDTGGATEHIFALFDLLGYSFSPRIRDLRDRRLFVFRKASTYPVLAPLIAGQVKEKLIEDHWDELLRLAASIKTGTVTASLILKKLAAYPRQNGLARALRELGRLERTLFTLRWLENPELRKKTNLELNKGEAKNALSRAVFFNRLGEIRDRSYENQRYRASGLNLIVASIILWNTVYLARAVEELQALGVMIEENLLSHVAPLGWEHVNLTGDYAWESPVTKGIFELRPLRLSIEELRSVA